MNTAGSNRIQLTTNETSDHNPAWSPDGTEIVFISTRSGSSEIYKMDSNGDNVIRLTNNSINEDYLKWSPDGSKIIFSSYDSYDFFIMSADGTGVTNITDTPDIIELHPDWSPDGNRIAFAADIPSAVGVFKIYVMNTDGSERIRLSGDPYDATGIDLQPSWSPDGSQIAYLYDIGWGRSHQLRVINADGTGNTSISSTGLYVNSPTWSPDGSKIAYASSYVYSWDPYIVKDSISYNNLDGSDYHNLTNIAEMGDRDPDWGP